MFLCLSFSLYLLDYGVRYASKLYLFTKTHYMKTKLLLTLSLALLLCAKAYSQGAIVVGSGTNPGCLGNTVGMQMIDFSVGGVVIANWYVDGVFVVQDYGCVVPVLIASQLVTAIEVATPAVTASLEIFAGTAPPPKPTVTVVGNDLQSSSATGNQWYGISGLISGATSQIYSPPVSGDYYVIVTDGICSSPCSDPVHINLSGIDQTALNSTVRMYPNPVTTELVLEMAGTQQEMRFEIVNAMAQVIYQALLNGRTLVQTSEFTPGIYFVKFDDGRMMRFEVAAH